MFKIIFYKQNFCQPRWYYIETSINEWFKRKYDEQDNRIYYENFNGTIKKYDKNSKLIYNNNE